MKEVRLVRLLFLVLSLLCISSINSLASPKKLSGFVIDTLRDEQNVFIQVNIEGALPWLLISELSAKNIIPGDLHEFTQCEVRENVKSTLFEDEISKIAYCSGVKAIPRWAGVFIPEGLTSETLYLADSSRSPVPLDHTILCRSLSQVTENNSTPKYFADIVISRNGSEVASKVIAGGEPLVFEDRIYYFLSSEKNAGQYMATVGIKASGTKKVFPLTFQKEATWPEEGLTFGVVNYNEATEEAKARYKIWFNDGRDGPVLFGTGEEESNEIEQSSKKYSFSIRPRYSAGIAAYKAGLAEPVPAEKKDVE